MKIYGRIVMMRRALALSANLQLFWQNYLDTWTVRFAVQYTCDPGHTRRDKRKVVRLGVGYAPSPERPGSTSGLARFSTKSLTRS